jgi:3-hydroxyisobutyryl-CoA hydrolase
MPLINDCFSAASVEEIVAQLKASNDSFAQETLTTIRKMSPFALKITKRALDEGSEQTLAECLQMEYRLSQRFVADHDFPEGIKLNFLIFLL